MSGDLAKLQGTWNITSLEADGQKLAPAAFQGSHIVIKGKKFTSVAMGAAYEGTMEIHASKKPKTFDLVFTAGPEKGNRNLGIYKLQADTWMICLATCGSERPKQFATQAGTGVALETLERVRSAKPRKASASRPAPVQDHASLDGLIDDGSIGDGLVGDGPRTELEGEWEMVEAIFNGQPLDPNMVKFCKRLTRGNVTTVLAGPQTMLKARFTVGSSKNPNTIDYVNPHGATKGKSQLGIFERKGATLKMCIAAPGQPRPTDFSSKPGDGRNYTSWRLNKK